MVQYSGVFDIAHSNHLLGQHANSLYKVGVALGTAILIGRLNDDTHFDIRFIFIICYANLSFLH